jgi:hypothetical protein
MFSHMMSSRIGFDSQQGEQIYVSSEEKIWMAPPRVAWTLDHRGGGAGLCADTGLDRYAVQI